MKALIVVDAQYDFMPVTKQAYDSEQGGALAVPDGDQIVPVINKLLPEFDLVIFTMDWHPKGMIAFASTHPDKEVFDDYEVKGKIDKLWPDHCVKDTVGAMLHEGIKFEKIPKDFFIFKKGLEKSHHPYSGFDGTGLAFFLQERKVDEVYISGLALDYCVKDTAKDAIENGFKTVVVKDATRAISKQGEKDTIHELLELGVVIVEEWELPLYGLMN